MKRGDIVVCALSGDYGKPRPAVVVQSDLFNPTHASVTVCPVTSHLIDAPLFRLRLEPTEKSGLEQESQMMVDKITAIKIGRIRGHIGALTVKQRTELDQAMKLWMGL